MGNEDYHQTLSKNVDMKNSEDNNYGIRFKSKTEAIEQLCLKVFGAIPVYESSLEELKLEALEHERVRVERDMLVAAGKLLAEEYEDRRSQWGDEYLWKKHEDTDAVNAAIAIFNAAKCEDKTNIDSISCPECDALASYGSNDGPCDAHKL